MKIFYNDLNMKLSTVIDKVKVDTYQQQALTVTIYNYHLDLIKKINNILCTDN